MEINGLTSGILGFKYLFSCLLSSDLNNLPKDQFSISVHSISFFSYLGHRFFFSTSEEIPTEFRIKRIEYLFEMEKNDWKEMYTRTHKHSYLWNSSPELHDSASYQLVCPAVGDLTTLCFRFLIYKM